MLTVGELVRSLELSLVAGEPGLEAPIRWVHISELENRRVDKVTDVVSEGDDVVVKVINIDDQGRIRLSRKQAFGVDPDEVLNLRG